MLYTVDFVLEMFGEVDVLTVVVMKPGLKWMGEVKWKLLFDRLKLLDFYKAVGLYEFIKSTWSSK